MTTSPHPPGTGGNTLWGNASNVVQAAAIHGGVHLHPRAEVPPIPRQAPAAPIVFINRALELNVLDRLAAVEGAGVAIAAAGPGGIGKTALLTRWLATRPQQFPGGVLYGHLGAGGPAAGGLAEVLAGWLRALGMPAAAVPATVQERLAWWRTLCAHQPLAMLVEEASAEQLLPLLPPPAGTLLLLTAPAPAVELLAAGVHHLPVPVLEPEAAGALFTAILDHHGHRHPVPELTAVLDDCGGNPAALRLHAAHYLLTGALPPASPPDPARPTNPGAGRGPAAEGGGGEPVGAAAAALAAALPPQAARDVQLLALHPPGPIPNHAAAALLDPPDPHELHARLAALSSAGLLQHTGTALVFSGQHIRAEAARRAAAVLAGPVRAAAVTRLREHYLRAATAAYQVLMPARRPLRPYPWAHPDHHPLPAEVSFPGSALAWLLEHSGIYRHLAHHAENDHAWRWLWQAVDALRPLGLYGKDHQGAAELETAAARAAHAQGDQAGVHSMRKRAAMSLLRQGEFEQARSLAALLLTAEEGEAVAAGHKVLGHLELDAGNHAAAAAAFGRALALRPEPGRGRALALIDLAGALLEHHPRDALRAAGAARRILAHLPDAHNAARALILTAATCAALARPGAELACLHAAAAALHRLGAPRETAEVARRLAELALAAGDTDDALRLYQHAARQFQLVDWAAAAEVTTVLEELLARAPDRRAHPSPASGAHPVPGHGRGTGTTTPTASP